MNKRLSIIWVAGLVIVASVLSSAQTNTDAQIPGTLKWHAEQAKKRGAKSIAIGEFPGLEEDINMDQALDRYTVITAIPVSSTVGVETDTILTWYKFKVLSVLSKAKECHPCNPALSIPSTLLPVSQDEIAIPISGGTATVDGVVITVQAAHPVIEMNQQYLFFLGAMAGSNQVAPIAGGAQEWAFRIDTEGKLHSVSNRVTRLSKDVMAKGSIDSVRQHIRSAKAGLP